MKLKFWNIYFLIGILFSVQALADGYSPLLTSQDQPWSVTASFGDGKYQLSSKDRENAIARLSLANEMLLSGDYALGLELGLQSGNHMTLDISSETLNLLSWLPVRTTLAPMLDLLITAKTDPLGASDFFAQLKGGVAYRYWDVHQIHFNTLTKLSAEVQAGFGYPITALANLSLLYQGVFGSDPHLTVNTLSQTGHISNIPALHAILLGLSVNL